MDVAKCLIFYYTNLREKIYKFYLINSVKKEYKDCEQDVLL
jgi:hypothetical protein